RGSSAISSRVDLFVNHAKSFTTANGLSDSARFCETRERSADRLTCHSEMRSAPHHAVVLDKEDPRRLVPNAESGSERTCDGAGRPDIYDIHVCVDARIGEQRLDLGMGLRAQSASSTVLEDQHWTAQ